MPGPRFRGIISCCWLLVAMLVAPLGGGRTAVAQVRPMQSDMDALLRDPANLRRLQEELTRRGMTQAEARARMRAMGYPERTLDGLMGDTTAVLTADVFAAMREMGMDSLALDSIRTGRLRARRATTVEDSLLLDSLRTVMRDGDDSTRAMVRRILRLPAVRSALVDSGFELFGRTIFEQRVGAMEVLLTGPVDEDYRLGPGDRLSIVLTGDQERAHSATVSPDGYIVIENLSAPLLVQNLTKREVEAQLLRLLGRAYSGLNERNTGSTRLLFTVMQQGVKSVKVSGDVVTPGAYLVPSSSTILSAIYQAGGPTDRGTMRRVQLLRAGRLIGTFDIYGYIAHGRASDDLRVQNGDVVHVPPRGGRVRIAGEVVRPMTYEIMRGETLQDLIALAGGFTAAADRRRLQIERTLPPSQRTEAGRDRQVIDVMDPELARGEVPPRPLEADDIVRVLRVATRVAGSVTVKGNVWSPGLVAFTPGMRLGDALRRADGVKSDSYLGQVNITRIKPDSTRVLYRTGLRDTLGTPLDDLVLNEGDEIEVFSASLFRADRTVEVAGAVKRPGEYPYIQGMTARDLILQAGGPLESALLTEAQLSRMPTDRTGGLLATMMRVPLDSLYLFDRGADGRSLGPPGVPAPARSPDVVLQPYDHLLVHRQPEWSYQRTVKVTGEVWRPGEHTLLTKGDRLRTVIERAGNITPDGNPNGVFFHRRDLGRIGVDYPAVLRDSTHNDNFLLVDGDSIFIPTFSAIVTVRGFVNSPVAVAYVRGADMDYYIRAAGGLAARAAPKRAFVTQPNGKVESRTRRAFVYSAPVPQPGSTVVVPEQDPNQRRDWAQITSAAVSVLGSLVAIAAIVRR